MRRNVNIKNGFIHIWVSSKSADAGSVEDDVNVEFVITAKKVYNDLKHICVNIIYMWNIQ